jgi:hypothetical protein
MRIVLASSASRAVSLRGHTAAVAFVAVVSASNSACFPLEDLSAYSQGTGGSGAGVSSGAPGDDEAPTGGGSQSTSPGSGEGVDNEQGLDPDTSIDPGDMSGSDNGAGCGGDCPASDGGSPASSDASSPPADRDAGPDVVPPLGPACALEEATGPNGRCYVAFATLLTWEAARADCRAREAGWDLASIRSRADNDFIDSMLTTESWLGGSDSSTEETWAWVIDGASFWQGEGPAGVPLNGAFSNWFDDEPNGSDTSDCMRLLIDGFWADLECEELRGYVCEGPPS